MPTRMYSTIYWAPRPLIGLHTAKVGCHRQHRTVQLLSPGLFLSTPGHRTSVTLMDIIGREPALQALHRPSMLLLGTPCPFKSLPISWPIAATPYGMYGCTLTRWYPDLRSRKNLYAYSIGCTPTLKSSYLLVSQEGFT